MLINERNNIETTINYNTFSDDVFYSITNTDQLLVNDANNQNNLNFNSWNLDVSYDVCSNKGYESKSLINNKL